MIPTRILNNGRFLPLENAKGFEAFRTRACSSSASFEGHDRRAQFDIRLHIDPAPGLTVLHTASRARRHKQVLERQGKRLGGQSPMLQTIALAMTRASCQRPDRPSA
jgi:hypothetical protein